MKFHSFSLHHITLLAMFATTVCGETPPNHPEVGLPTTGGGISETNAASNGSPTSGALRFVAKTAEMRVDKPGESSEYVFSFENSGSQPVAVASCRSACPACASVKVDPEIIEPGAKGRVVVNVLPSRNGGQTPISLQVMTVEAGADHQYDLNLNVLRPEVISNDSRSVARLAKRPPSGLRKDIATGSWQLKSVNPWMDLQAGENTALSEQEREAIQEDFPIGQTVLEFKADQTFRFTAGQHLNGGQWSVDGNFLKLEIKRPDCPTCEKTWVLEAVTASRDQLVVDLADEDEGSPMLVRFGFARQPEQAAAKP